MHINCPLKDKSDVIPLIEDGADLFYAGVSSEMLFGKSNIIQNRRPWNSANFTDIDNFKEAVSLIHKENKKIHLTLNEHHYTKAQIDKIIQFISENKDIDGFIVVDISLILELKKKFPKIHLIASTGTHIMNKEAIKFYSSFDISEIVLPRHLKISEIAEIVKDFPNIKFECFIKNHDCANIDGLCRYSHGVFDKDNITIPCFFMKDFKIYPNNAEKKDIISKHLNNYNKLMFRTCGACFIQDLDKLGINSIKIVGRNIALEFRLKDVEFMKKAISKLNLPRNEFFKSVNELHSEIHPNASDENCMYEE